MVTKEPLTLEEAKAHLRVEHNEDNGYINALIAASREYAEHFQNRLLAPREGPAAENDGAPAFEEPGAMEKHAMLLLIGHWYEHRESVVVGAGAVEVPQSAKDLLWFNRRVSV